MQIGVPLRRRQRSQARLGLHERPSLESSHPCIAETERSSVMVILKDKSSVPSEHGDSLSGSFLIASNDHASSRN